VGAYNKLTKEGSVMAEAISTTQNQNTQLVKTFMVAFFAMLISVPIVTVITASIVKAQFGNVAYAQAAQQTILLVLDQAVWFLLTKQRKLRVLLME
jgi:hypothetical protein